MTIQKLSKFLVFFFMLGFLALPLGFGVTQAKSPETEKIGAKSVRIELRLGEKLTPDEAKVINLLLTTYKHEARSYERNMLEKTIRGDLTDQERKQIQKQGGFMLRGSFDQVVGPNGCIFWAYIERPWWLFGRNQHLAGSRHPNGQPCPIDEIHTFVNGTHNGNPEYAQDWVLKNASGSWSRNHARAPGRATSEVIFTVQNAKRRVNVDLNY